MIRAALAALLAVALPVGAAAQQRPPRDRHLERSLQALSDSFDGRVGIYVRNLRTGVTAEVNADELFPTASMIKVPILLTLFDSLEHGSLSVQQRLMYTDSLEYPGGDILGSFRDSTPVEMSRVIMLTATMSDNTAALWLQSLAGGGVAINHWLSSNGFDSTRMNSRTPGRHDAWERYGWGQTTPREIANLLVMIREGRAVSHAASQELYRVLTRTFWNAQAISQIPPWIQAASKQGAVDRSRSEVVLVNAPHGDYVFSVITKNQADTSWALHNAGWDLIRKVSAMLWKRFEPGYPWKPPAGWEKFKASEE
jgi:beta-lactamase class A